MFDFIMASIIALCSDVFLMFYPLLLLMLILHFIQIYWCRVIGSDKAFRTIWITGLLGVTLHELSHLIIIYIFGHKATEVVLFQINPRTDSNHETLGYVCHSYDPTKPYHVLGNFFIGIAPIIGGVGSISFVTYTLLDNGPEIVHILYNLPNFSFANYYQSISLVVFNLYESAVHTPLYFLLWFYLVAAFSFHLSPSPSDLKGSLRGLFAFFVLLALIKFSSQFFDFTLFSDIKDVVIASSFLLIISILITITVILFRLLFLITINIAATIHDIIQP